MKWLPYLSSFLLLVSTGCFSRQHDVARVPEAEPAPPDVPAATGPPAAAQPKPASPSIPQQQLPPPPPLAKEIKNALGSKLVLIPPGHFTMGSATMEKDRGDDERAHEVDIRRPFYLGA